MNTIPSRKPKRVKEFFLASLLVRVPGQRGRHAWRREVLRARTPQGTGIHSKKTEQKNRWVRFSNIAVAVALPVGARWLMEPTTIAPAAAPARKRVALRIIR